VGVFAGFAAFVAATSGAFASEASAAHLPAKPAVVDPNASARKPWIEGVDPTIENSLFFATYEALSTHNVLKVYAFDAGGYESAAIRISGRVPHEPEDLSLEELASEAVTLIHTTFDRFPDVQHVDIWATVPVPQSEATSVENTVFSVSADRSIYEKIDDGEQMSDLGFLGAFGRVWVAPGVPR
jgi:hypothetical protein